MSLKDHFQYLDKLRESGRCNMWGAGAYLQNERGLSRDRAKEVHMKWMETFDGKTPLDERVAAASHSDDRVTDGDGGSGA